MDVEATRSVWQAEVGSTLTMLDRTAERFDIRPDWLVADTAYGSKESLVEIVLKRQILRIIPVIRCRQTIAGNRREGQGRAHGWNVVTFRLHLGRRE